MDSAALFVFLALAGSLAFLWAWGERRSFQVTLRALGLGRRVRSRPPPMRCVVLADTDLAGLREMFLYAARRLGGKCDFNHWLQSVERGPGGPQVLSCRIVRDGHQYHFRVHREEGRYLITGHYEPTPEKHPLRHYLGVSADPRRACRDLQMFFDEYRARSFQI